MNWMKYLFPFRFLFSVADDADGGGDEGGGDSGQGGTGNQPVMSSGEWNDMLRGIGVEEDHLPKGDGSGEGGGGSADGKVGDIDDDLLPPDDKKTGEGVAGGDPDLTAGDIKVEDYPEPARKNVGALRKRLEKAESLVKALGESGVKYEFDKDGKVVVKLPSSGEDVTALKKTIDEQDAKIGRLSLMESASFRRKYVEPFHDRLAGIMEVVAGLAPDMAQGDKAKNELPALINRLAQMPPSARASYLHNNHPDIAGTVLPMFLQVDQLHRERVKALEEWKQTSKEIQEQESAQIHAQTKAAKERLREQAVSKLASSGYFMFKKMDGTDERARKWNAHVDALNDQVAVFFEDPDPVRASEAFARAAASEYLLGVVQKMKAQVQDLREKLAAYGDVEPAIRGGGGDGERKTKLPAEMSPQDAARMIVMGR